MASIIDLNSAKSLIKEYRQQNTSAGGPGLKTNTQQNLNGFFIDRASLEDLLSNPNVAGISLDIAKHPDFVGKGDHVFTLVYSGAEPAPQGSSTPYVNTGAIYTGPPPCPPICSNVGG